jgi:hypothetical protein
MRVGHRAWALGVWLLMGIGGCGSESNGGASSLVDLGIDDGASEGKSASLVATKDKGAELTLDTGAAVKVPKDAVDSDIELGLKRPPDSEALVLVKRLGSKQSAVSAPYVVTPHGTKFKTEVEVSLPIGKSHDRDKLKVRWLEDEKDTRWKDLGPPQVDGDKALIKVDHFSVLVLVEDDSAGAIDVPADAARPGSDIEGDSGAAQRDAGGDVSEDDSGGAPDVEPRSDGGAPEGGTSTGGPSATVLSKLPIDLATDCPAEGCTITLGVMPDGVWADCPQPTEPANFDPATFDFAAACAQAQPSQTEVEFVHDGIVKELELEFGGCIAYSGALHPAGTKVFAGLCDQGYAEIGVTDVRRAADGTLYYYLVDDCDGTCSTTVELEVFRPGDTSALNADCVAETTQIDQTCAGATLVLPFGPSGVGPLAAALRDTTWIACEDGGENPLEACSSVVTDPFAQGWLDVMRFNDADFDDLTYDSGSGWEADCGAAAGATATRLRRFVCADPSDPDGWGALESTWEVQRIGTRNYLLISEPFDDDVDIYVSAPSDLIPTPDPCSAAPVPTCVIR